MLSTETIIIIAIVIVALSALGYYCYTKITSHERYINTIHQRCQQLEIILTQPSPPMEIDTVFNTPSSLKEETRTTTICDEENGMCYLKPIHEEDEERGGGGDEDESLVQEEIDRLLSSSVKETTSHSKKKKPSLPAPPTSTIEEE